MFYLIGVINDKNVDRIKWISKPDKWSAIKTLFKKDLYAPTLEMNGKDISQIGSEDY